MSDIQTADAAVSAPSPPVKRSLDNGTAEATTAEVTVSSTKPADAHTNGDNDDDQHRQKRARTVAEGGVAESTGDAAAAPAKREKIHGIAMIKEE